jgi:hypothetical protein
MVSGLTRHGPAATMELSLCALQNLAALIWACAPSGHHRRVALLFRTELAVSAASGAVRPASCSLPNGPSDCGPVSVFQGISGSSEFLGAFLMDDVSKSADGSHFFLPQIPDPLLEWAAAQHSLPFILVFPFFKYTPNILPNTTNTFLLFFFACPHTYSLYSIVFTEALYTHTLITN